eukprot:TRINITY_DN6454_c0_g1_i1.p1 TRINITY_DN6454_c0_g1~~TRINITY_DN6454_c0_g1_i1.p1  ORF type:complete len:324 (-),score=60.71 TRINITY_DN6454_c0_g1_i1:53-1024(-)
MLSSCPVTTGGLRFVKMNLLGLETMPSRHGENTDEWDGTSGDQPRYTQIVGNYIHELGIHEKQSSAYFQAKTCHSFVFNNIIFNMPRAGININDGFGGNNTIMSNLIWNTCRETGDHGPINTWDRLPFLTDASGVASFQPLPNQVTQNFIIANYGGSQGIDNDDGSSWYLIFNNLFYDADGFKMDYGGHNSHFYSNLVITRPYDGQNCLILDPFLEGNGHAFYNNTCVQFGCSSSRPGACDDTVSFLYQCDPEYVTVKRNQYFTPHGNATVSCDGQGGDRYSLPDLQSLLGLEKGSSFAALPNDTQILDWANMWIHSWVNHPL